MICCCFVAEIILSWFFFCLITSFRIFHRAVSSPPLKLFPTLFSGFLTANGNLSLFD